jgi:hypothetical protein
MDDRTRAGDGLILSRVWLAGQNAPLEGKNQNTLYLTCIQPSLHQSL